MSTFKPNYSARRRSEAYAPQSGAGAGTTLISAKQQEWIKSLCEMKRVAMPSLTGVDSKGASEIIQKLQALPNWREASQAQINKIISRCKDMALDIPEMGGLSMSKAGKWIEFLDNKWNTEFANRVTQKQIDMMNKMVICPDIDSSELMEIPQELWDKLDEAEMDLSIALSGQIAENIETAEKAVTLAKEAIDKHAESFEIEKVTKQIASDFIGKNQQVYYKWVGTRLSDGQKSLINNLLTRMGNPELEENVLMQFSREQADEYIDQLQKEMGDSSLKGFGDQAQMMMEVPEEWGGKGKEDRIPQTGCVWLREQWEVCIHALYATVGQQAEVEVIEATEQYKALEELISFLSGEGIDDIAIIGCLSTMMKNEDAIELLQDMRADAQAEVQGEEMQW